MNYVTYFEPIERAREAGNVDDALLKAQQALLQAGQLGDPVLAINAYAHQLLVFKDQFTHSGEDFYLHIMHSLAIAGLTLAHDLGVTGQPLAIMYLRIGDYHFHYKKYTDAIAAMEKAVELARILEAEKPGEYSEYLSHLGKAQVFGGQANIGIKNLEVAVRKTTSHTELREFHRKIVHSGNILRLLFAYYQVGKEEDAKKLLLEVYPIALELKEKENMPIRLEQVEKLASAWSVSLSR